MTTTAAPTTTVGISRALQLATVSATTALGAVLGLIVRGLVAWLERTVDGSPGPLRVAAQLPVGVAAGILTVVGLIGGIILVAAWQHEVAALTVADDHVELAAGGHRRWMARAEIGEAFLGRGGELTFLDRRGRLLAAAGTDGVPKAGIARALTDAGYPWRGEADPYEAEYTLVVQGRGDADLEVEALLRERAVARAEKRAPTARDLRLRLGEVGVVVRDRGDEQEFRPARHTG
ncbi:YqeB family protein [Tsukamurella ocularis]|uniref:YqeB family protein n=1 Tax=Tsukamurella ocularis TaxID=1970234 RepID=UPI0039F0013C